MHAETVVLIVDDDDALQELLARALTSNGYKVRQAFDGQEAMQILTTLSVDAVILDVMMPGKGGIDVCREIRSTPGIEQLPILILTARSELQDITDGLEAGADDFLTKPFEIKVLIARLNAILRRGPSGPLSTDADHIGIEGLRIYNYRPVAYWQDCEIQLTTLEHRLLFYLVANASRIVSVDELLESVWHYPHRVGDPSVVHVTISRLRSKLQTCTHSDRQIIINVRNRGYQISI